LIVANDQDASKLTEHRSFQERRQTEII